MSSPQLTTVLPHLRLELAGSETRYGPALLAGTFLKGLTVFKVTHRGDGAFRVKLFDREGKFVEQVAAKIDPYEGSIAVTIQEEGIYAIGIYANGEWTLNLA